MKLISLTIIASLILLSGCQIDQKKRLAMIDDADAGLTSAVATAYNDKLITKADVQAVRPASDAAAAALQAAYLQANSPLLFQAVNAAEAAYESFAAHSTVKAAKAATTQKASP